MNLLVNNPALPKQRENIMLTSLISNYDDLKGNNLEHILEKIEKKQEEDFFKKITYYLNIENPKEILLLLTYAIITTIVVIIIDSFSYKILLMRFSLLSSENFSAMNIVFYVLSAIFLGLLATSMGYFISPNTDGSGIPELKVVLSGLNLFQYYDFRSLIGKTLGLLCVLMAGVEVGRAGAYVHIAGAIGKQILKLGYFQSIKNGSKRMLLVCSAVVGVTLSLGTPVGAILFAIEQSSTVYLVGNIWKTFFVAIICLYTKNNVRHITNLSVNSYEGELIQEVKFDYELIYFIILGLIGGIFSGIICILIGKVALTRKSSTNRFYNNRFWYIVIVCLVCSVFQVLLPPLRSNHSKMFSILFKPNSVSKYIFDTEMMNKHSNITNISNISNMNDTYKVQLEDQIFDSTNKPLYSNPFASLIHPNESTTLILCLICKMIMLVLSNTANIPLGVIGPIFCCGGIFGRLYGHILFKLFNIRKEHLFSLVGAACFLSGATHSIAPSVIIFEITGESSHFLHLLFASLISNLICKSISVSVFDVILFIRNLPYLATVKSAKLYSLTLNELKDKITYYLIDNSNATEINDFYSISRETIVRAHIINQINTEDDGGLTKIFDKTDIISSLVLLYKIPNKFYYSIPVIDSNQYLIGSVVPRKLLSYIESQYRLNKYKIPKTIKTNVKELIEHLKKKFFPTRNYYIQEIYYKVRKLFYDLTDLHTNRLNLYFTEESMYRLIVRLKEYSLYNPQSFLNDRLKIKDRILEMDTSNITLDVSFSALRIQYFFTFLSVSHVFAIDKGKLVGILGKEDFIKKSLNIR